MRPARIGCALLLLAPAACLLPGPDSLVNDSNAQLIITGALTGDRIDVSVGELRRELVAKDSALLTVYLSLPSGDHEGRVEALRGRQRLCADFVLEAVGASVIASASVDLRAAPRCDATPDAGERDAARTDREDTEPDAEVAGDHDALDAGVADSSTRDAAEDDGDDALDASPGDGGGDLREGDAELEAPDGAGEADGGEVDDGEAEDGGHAADDRREGHDE